jgi:hypothetical protein
MADLLRGLIWPLGVWNDSNVVYPCHERRRVCIGIAFVDQTPRALEGVSPSLLDTVFWKQGIKPVDQRRTPIYMDALGRDFLRPVVLFG